jgi:hypothetical protein
MVLLFIINGIMFVYSCIYNSYKQGLIQKSLSFANNFNTTVAKGRDVKPRGLALASRPKFCGLGLGLEGPGLGLGLEGPGLVNIPGKRYARTLGTKAFGQTPEAFATEGLHALQYL